MIYHVRAKFREETAAALLTKLADGSIAIQHPDGSELVASMERAIVNSDGQVEWSEKCFCPSPLLHERATVLDLHFDDIETEPIDAHTNYVGRPFKEYLQAIA
jgi:hypothetical protein